MEVNMAPLVKPRYLGVPPILQGGRFEDGAVVYEKELAFGNPSAFEASLAEWLGRYVSRASVAPLMANADGLREVTDYLMHAPTTMSGRRTIRLHLVWDKLSNGQWYVEGVGFSLRDSVRNIHVADQARIRERALDAAERDARQNIPDWKLYFDIGLVGPNWLQDVAQGEQLLAKQFEAAHEVVKKLEPVMKNPIGPDMDDDKSILWELSKAIIGVGPPGYLLDAFKAGDAADKVKSNYEAQSGFKAAGDIMDLGLSLAIDNPVTGLASTILGSFLEIAIANDTARVAKARGRLYMDFVSGWLSKICPPAIYDPKPPPRAKNSERATYYTDKLMVEFGAKQSASYSAREKFLVQLALLHFVATHNTENSWNFQNRMEKNWKFPTHYTAFWSREILARAFIWQFFKGKYRYH
jgi:hypothetical protein